MRIDGKVEGAEKALVTIRKVPARILREAKRIFTRHTVLLQGYVRQEYLTGGTSEDRLAVRSGALRSSTRALPVEETSGTVNSGLGFGTVYARTHVGPQGQVTTIRPVNKQYLAIPLAAAKTPAGVSKGGPQSGRWGDTFIARSHAGNLIIFGRRVVQKGAKSGMTAGKIVPLFVLKKEVKVKTRVFPERILAWSKRELLSEFDDIGVSLKEAGDG